MMNVFRWGASLGLITLICTGCTNANNAPNQTYVVTPEVATSPMPGFSSPSSTGYPNPGSYPVPTIDQVLPGYPEPSTPNIPVSTDGRSQTALQSYAFALKTAQEYFSPQANLRAILPSRAMLNNLGNPPVPLGWFYMFRAPDQGADFFVQIVDGEVSGTEKLIPLEFEQPLQMPIDVSQVRIDSDKALEIFRQNAPAKGITVLDGVAYDLELVLLEDQNQPVWSVVAPESGLWIYSINAVTGEELANPRS